MSNKYFEKAAAIFASAKYKKTLSENDRKKYDEKYQAAGISSVKNFGKSLGASGMVGAGFAIGSHVAGQASKPLAQRIANHIKNKDIIKGERDLGRILNKGLRVHGVVRGVASAAGGILGVMPGMMYADKIRHEYAKKMIEKNRNKNG